MEREQADLEGGEEQEQAQESARPAGTMLGVVAGQVGDAAMRRKLQRRALQRKAADGSGAAAANAKDDVPADGAHGGVFRSVSKDGTPLVSDAAEPKKTELAKLKKGEIAQPVDLGAGSAFNKDIAGTPKQWWKVKILRGENVGKEGWVQAGDLDSSYTVKDQGKSEYSAKVAGGEVDIHTGQQLELLGSSWDNKFTLDYKGKDASEARWLQFIWREIIGVNDKGTSEPVKDSITTSGGKYQLTEGGTKDTPGTPKKENYNTDSADKSEPFYEAAFTADRTADSTSMNDQPAAAVATVQKAFANNAAKSVVSRAHFTTFLIKGKKVAFKTNIGVEWNFAKADDVKAPPKGVHTVSGSGEASSLPSTIAERFHEQYPGYKDIK